MKSAGGAYQMTDFPTQIENMREICDSVVAHARELSSIEEFTEPKHSVTYFGFYCKNPDRGVLLSMKTAFELKVPQRYYYLEILDMDKDAKKPESWFTYFFTHPEGYDGEIKPWMIADHFVACFDDHLRPEGERQFPQRTEF
jgi:hypothetical protein